MIDTKDKIKTCARCHAKFECNASDITNCDCQKVVLSATISYFINQNHKDCLCLDCLKYLAENKDI